jgi:hypothetical protein
MRDLKHLRDRVWHSIGPQVATATGLSIGELRMFALGSFHPDQERLTRLCRYFGFTP